MHTEKLKCALSARRAVPYGPVLAGLLGVPPQLLAFFFTHSLLTSNTLECLPPIDTLQRGLRVLQHPPPLSVSVPPSLSRAADRQFKSLERRALMRQVTSHSSLKNLSWIFDTTALGAFVRRGLFLINNRLCISNVTSLCNEETAFHMNRLCRMAILGVAAG